MTVFTVFGGHGKVALHFTKLARESKHVVYNVIRNASHKEDVEERDGRPKILSLEEASANEIAGLLKETQTDTVVFSAGAGGKGGPERTKAVDYEGAVKVYDAMKLAGLRRIIMVSAIDNRDMNQPPPIHYTTADRKMSEDLHKALPTYYHYKFLADQELIRRTEDIDWTILRPSILTDDPSSGMIALGNVSIKQSISRETVARAILGFASNAESQHLVIDMTEGDVPITTAILAFLGRRESSYDYPL
ncbi:SOCG_01127-like, conserved protein [Schizosaccharomyces osmophilus]|uniref:SOCG_01127-like, conserved protein n=1 Tax=Schizosaccharomyces osmophilus TaxID=2545709 RepID=A0AAE9WDY9_9SCHI|nr:SOCG_01127-like, conserved protein [Schizosaccharomyces osmophilus]WBW74128.1 SOCG_01127-like, conserved protein [Schizosaccharomyces osmophilus]